jgi:hypothetical protein
VENRVSSRLRQMFKKPLRFRGFFHCGIVMR